MSTRDQIRAAIDRLPEERLAELSEFVRRLEAPPPPPEAEGGEDAMEILMSIKLDGLPADFSENFREYRHGPKGLGEDVP